MCSVLSGTLPVEIIAGTPVESSINTSTGSIRIISCVMETLQ